VTYQDSPQRITAYRETYVQPYSQGELTRQETEFLATSTRMAGEIMSHRQMTHHVRSDDSAITHSLGSLIYSFAYILVIAIITGAFIMLATWAFDGDGWPMFLLWLLVWGVGCLMVMVYNREQGLRYSAGGIATKKWFSVISRAYGRCLSIKVSSIQLETYWSDLFFLS
jgi:hypothetical protein